MKRFILTTMLLAFAASLALALLIVVGVALDLVGQIESHMLARHYDGFLDKGKKLGGRGRR